MTEKRILIADDNAGWRSSLQHYLNLCNYTVIQAADGDEALEQARRHSRNLDCILLDYDFQAEKTGLDVIRALKDEGILSPVIMMSSKHERGRVAIAATYEFQVIDFVDLPCDPEVIEKALECVFQRSAGNQQKVQARFAQAGFVSNDPAMGAVCLQGYQAAVSGFPVLLLGQRGVGKNRFARAIHTLSDRRDKPFIMVNCAGLDPGTMESQLFGHRKGSFTGATADHAGYFPAAADGTIFLDEITALPPEFQTKLNHVIEYGVYHRMGDTGESRTEARIIAATNKSLPEAMQSGAFNADLHDRFVWQITIPPLSERKADLPLLIREIIRELSGQQKVAGLHIDPAAIPLIAACDCQGNVRQLRNLLARAMTHAQSQGRAQITRSDIQQSTPEAALPTDAEATGAEELSVALGDLIEQKIAAEPGDGQGATTLRQQVERSLIIEALRKTNGNHAKAARLLGYKGPAGLNYYIRLYGLKKEEWKRGRSDKYL